jgi:hypothetical protein
MSRLSALVTLVAGVLVAVSLGARLELQAAPPHMLAKATPAAAAIDNAPRMVAQGEWIRFATLGTDAHSVARQRGASIADLSRFLAPEAGTAIRAIGGGAPSLTMDAAVARAASHVGPDGFMETTGNGLNYQFRSMATDANGNVIARMGRFDVNLLDPHVGQFGPHLNLETQINGRIISNLHFDIDPLSILAGDMP